MVNTEYMTTAEKPVADYKDLVTQKYWIFTNIRS